MPIEHWGTGGVSFVGKDAVDLYRMLTLLKGLEFEIKTGMRLTAKAPTCYSIIKREYGFKGNKQKVLEQFEAYYQVMKNKVAVVDRSIERKPIIHDQDPSSLS